MLTLLSNAHKRRALVQLVRLDRPIGIYLLLWPALWSLWFAAQGMPDLKPLIVIVLGVVITRMAGCAINDFADRKFDPKVERTRRRPLATGAIAPRQAVGVFVVLMIIAFGLVLLTNALTISLSLGGAFLAATYPFMKRYTYLPQFYLGAAFGWAVPMAYAAQANELTPTTWLLFIAAVLWATAYDTMYAMVDRPDDLKIGVKSTAILFGDLDRLAIGLTQALMLLTLVFAGQRAAFGSSYFAGLAAAAVLCLYQQWLIRGRDRDACFAAFLNNHWLGMVVFAGVAMDTWH